MSLMFSVHARKRMQQRAIGETDIEKALDVGLRVHRAGAIFFFLGRRASELGHDGLNGLTVVLSPVGQVMTAYKNRRGLKAVKSKASYFRYESKWHPRPRLGETGEARLG